MNCVKYVVGDVVKVNDEADMKLTQYQLINSNSDLA